MKWVWIDHRHKDGFERDLVPGDEKEDPKNEWMKHMVLFLTVLFRLSKWI